MNFGAPLSLYIGMDDYSLTNFTAAQRFFSR
jgi:hypothetical protein